ncbi:MAG: hypothetical protein ACRERU_03510, partial [Methylococcales bacterium]
IVRTQQQNSGSGSSRFKGHILTTTFSDRSAALPFARAQAPHQEIHSTAHHDSAVNESLFVRLVLY